VKLTSFTPVSLRGYQSKWLSGDVIAGLTLAAVAIPETMGYTSISETPLVTGLYTVIFPTILFALLGSSKLLVVGADSATAAILAAGLAGLGMAGLTPYSSEWLAMCGLVALECGVLLLLARILKLGFIGDFLSASVLIGFLTGVGIQVFSGQIPTMLGFAKGSGTWLQQQKAMIQNIIDGNINWWTAAFALLTVVIILGFKKFAPKVPGAVIAVVVSVILSAALDAQSHGVTVVGKVTGGFPPIGIPSGLSWSDVGLVFPTAISCFVLIIAQSAATSRSFAMRHGDRADINRDLVGLSGASFAAGLSGTFVVNGSPTKTQILDEDRGRTQLANLVMSLIVLLFVMFFTSLLQDMPNAVLGGIVFLIGVDLIDISGLKRVARERYSEFVIAIVTACTVFLIGVEQGIILAIVLSLLELVRRQYRPKDFVLGVSHQGQRSYEPAEAGAQSAPGLLIFRYDADLFYANASAFSDDVQNLMLSTPDPVKWVVLDCSALSDVDYSAGITISGLIDFVRTHDADFFLAAPDDGLKQTLTEYGVMAKLPDANVFATLSDAIDGFAAAHPETPSAAGS
jgi:high affinity sulfate transporter 1